MQFYGQLKNILAGTFSIHQSEADRSTLYRDRFFV